MLNNYNKMVSGGLLTSAGGVLSLLDDEEEEIQVFALTRLDELVDVFWAEISESIRKIELLFENESFPERELAALVASKVFYHLGSFQDSLTFALKAGSKFDVNSSSEYTETIISKCIDHYTSLRVKKFEDNSSDSTKEIDPRLESVVNRMFDRCFTEHKFQQAAGIALETRRIDLLERAIQESRDVEGMLSYCLKVTLSLLNNRKFRNMVLEVLVRIYSGLKTPDYINICQCYIFLNDAERTAQILETLLRGTHDEVLTAYQIAFDLYESATQQFLSRIQECFMLLIPNLITPATSTEDTRGNTMKEEAGVIEPTSDDTGGDTNDDGGGEEMAVSSTEQPETSSNSKDEEVEPMDTTEGDEKKPLEGEEEEEEGSSLDTVPVGDPEDDEFTSNLKCVSKILSGEKTIALHQEFLIRCNHTDLQILTNTKEAGRNSITHNATVVANGLTHFGTTSDVFLRENLDWLKRASNWAKFTATATLGVIHYGHETEALNLMSSYLPKDSNGSPYAEGGGLYALGLIHANHGEKIVEYLKKELRNNQNEVVKHGACYGVGLVAMGTADNDVYELLKDSLCQDDAVVGEAAGLAMGLVMIGTRSPTAIEDMIEYAQETQHEKIQRGLALGIAMLFYGQLEEADTAIEQLCQHKDPLLRRAGMFTIATAYCGTGDNAAIRRLLHVAVSDVDSDVRRVAVMCLGFILFRNPEQCPNVVSLLAESFNPHVRCGAAWALGIACAASGNKEALAIIEPMLSDPVPFVQQGALIASAMILVQHTEGMSSKSTKIREKYSKLISDKLEDSVAKFGAIIAQGIIDAGGRNVTISLQSRTGHTHMPTVVGLLVFSQFWFWYPLSLFLSLAFTPTAVIGLTKDLQMPKMEIRSNVKPSLYGYVPHLEKEKGKEKEKVVMAVLSVTAKKLKSKQKKGSTSGESDEKTKEKEEKEVESMEVDSTPTPAAPEPTFEMLANPARVLPQQLKVIAFDKDSRYQSIKPISSGGILIFKDSQPDLPEDLIQPLKVVIPGQDDEADEPPPPEPFEYTEDD